MLMGKQICVKPRWEKETTIQYSRQSGVSKIQWKQIVYFYYYNV